jgi:ABC-type amino acid transport substrate-binding protein
MEKSVETMGSQLSSSIDATSLDATLPCDAQGMPISSEPRVRGFPAGSTMDQIVNRGRLIVGVTYSIPLFGELDPLSGDVRGFDNELAKEIAREMGLRADQIEFVDVLGEERLPALQENRVDMVIMGITITPEREELVSFSRPYYLAGQSILVRRNNRSVSSLRDLSGKKVCVIAGSTSVPTLTEKAPQAIQVPAPSAGDCLTQVVSGSVDATSTDDIILAGFAAENDDVVLVGGQFTEEPYGVGIPEGKTDMVEFVDSVIARMIEDGRWGRLYYEHLADVPGLPDVREAKQRLFEIR